LVERFTCPQATMRRVAKFAYSLLFHHASKYLTTYFVHIYTKTLDGNDFFYGPIQKRDIL